MDRHTDPLTRPFAHSPTAGEIMSTFANVSRRRFLQAAGLGSLSLGTPGLVAARVGANQTRLDGAAEKSCIFILLCGGPSHLDTWDLKPAAPAEIRGLTSRSPRPCPACD